jgi:hypothetical protein
VIVSLFGSQNQVGYGLSVAPQNQWKNEDGAGHASRSRGLLRVEVSQARVFQFASKLAEVRRRVVRVAPSWRLHRNQVEDGWVDATCCVRPCYPCVAIFFIIGPMSVLVF